VALADALNQLLLKTSDGDVERVRLDGVVPTPCVNQNCEFLGISTTAQPSSRLIAIGE